MREKIAVLMALACLSASASAEAPSFTGGSLLAICRLHDEAFDTVCQAYISGYFAGLSAGSVLTRTPASQICIPQTLGPKDVRPVIQTYLAAHPEWASRDAATLV